MQKVNKTTLRRVKRVSKKYTEEQCVKLYQLHEDYGIGAKSIANMLKIHTNAVDSMIDVGRILVEDLKEWKVV